MLHNIASISSFVSKSLIGIIPKQVIVLFDKNVFTIVKSVKTVI